MTRRARTLVRELDDGGALKLRAREFRPIAGGAHRLRAAFEANPGEKLYGMGQYQQAILDLKGSTLELAHRNSQASVPFVMSSAGYGFLWNNPGDRAGDFRHQSHRWVAESTAAAGLLGHRGLDSCRHHASLRRATGHVPMMPEYGMGYWQCKLRYRTQEQLLEVAREHKRRGLPSRRDRHRLLPLAHAG